MSAVFSIANGVFQSAKAVYDCVQLVKTNKAQCQRLAQRIEVAETSVKSLDQHAEQTHFQEGLKMLTACFVECLAYVEQFAQQKRWYKQVLKVKDNELQFQLLNDQLRAALFTLNLGITVEQITNREQDVADQKADAEALKAGQAEILSLNQKMMEELQDFRGAATQRDKLMALQLRSLKEQLGGLSRTPREEKASLVVENTIPYCELLFDALLEKTSSSTVYKGRWEDYPVTIKLLTFSLSRAESAEFIREIVVIKRLRHPQIVQFYGACLEEGQACLVMEAMPKGSLHTQLSECILTPLQQKKIALDIVRGLQYLHKNGMVHRDLRSESVLLTEQYGAKLANFSFTKTPTYSIQSLIPLELAIPWCAPEVLNGESASDKSDIYALGTVLWELFTGKRPFESLSLSSLTQKILAGDREHLPADMPIEVKTAITACWSSDPAMRPNIKEVMQALEAYDPAFTYYQKAKTLEEAKNFKAAGEQYQAAADLGLASAMTSLGMFALLGRGEMLINKAKAHQLFLSAAEKGHKRAMHNLAVMLDQGDGIPQNQANALKWYQQVGSPPALARVERLKEKLSAVNASSSP